MAIQKRNVNRELVGVDEAAKILGGLSPWTLRAWAYKGKLASHKIGTRLMFERAELNRVIAESERPRLNAGEGNHAAA